MTVRRAPTDSPDLRSLSMYVSSSAMRDASATKKGLPRARSGWISASESAMPGGQPAITQPIAGPCDSPNVVTVKRVPRVLPDMFEFYREADPPGGIVIRGDLMQANRLQFDRYVLDLDRGCLLLDGNDVALRPKTFGVLRYLAENAGRLVSKEDLFSAVWPNLVVTDDTLVQSIGELRRALQDDGARFIRTIPRRGYRFDAAVSRIGTPPSAPAAPSSPPP